MRITRIEPGDDVAVEIRRGNGSAPMTQPPRLFARYEIIIRAYEAALAGRDPGSVDIGELLPVIHRLVPGVEDDEIVGALRWSARQDQREAEPLTWWG